MAVTVEKVAGITIDVDDLIAVRARLEGLNIGKIRRRTSLRSGSRDIRLRGRGMEYEESRAYVPGDDVRTMDWRVMARTGEAYSKLFAEEKERSSLIAVDLSASMFFGTRHAFKSHAAAQVAAHVGWLASFSGESIGGLVTSTDHHMEIRPGKTRSGLLGLFHHLAQVDARRQLPTRGRSRLNFLLGELKRVVRPGTDIVLISDFLGADTLSLQILAALCRHSQVFAYWIHDDSECQAWPRGAYPIEDARDGLYLDLANDQHRRLLEAQQAQHRQRVETLCAGFDIPLLSISCNLDVSRQFGQILQARP